MSYSMTEKREDFVMEEDALAAGEAGNKVRTDVCLKSQNGPNPKSHPTLCLILGCVMVVTP